MQENELKLPIEIKTEAGDLIAKLEAAGWLAQAALYDPRSFGNWYVDLERAGRKIRLLKDRSQYMLQGPDREIKAAGLWKAFNGIDEFSLAVIEWATSLPADK